MTTITQASSIPKLEHDEAMALAETEYERFAQLIRGLSPSEWQLPTICHKWNVREVVAHLVGEAEGNASPRTFLRRWRQGQKLSKQRGDDHWIHGMNDIQVRENAFEPADLVRKWETLMPRALAGRRSFPRFLRPVRSDFGPVLGKRSMAYLMDAVITRDIWMHRIDLGRAVGREPVLTDAHDGRLIADMVADWAQTHGHAFDLELTGPAGGHFTQGAHGEHLRIDAIEWIWVLSGRGTGTGLLGYQLPL